MRGKFKITPPTFLNTYLKKVFRPNFLSSKNISVSLDIGRAYVKAVSLEKDKQIINITGFSCEKIEAHLKNSISKALSNIPTRKKEVALSISGQSVVLRYVNMPIMSNEELTKSMNFEMEKYIPFKKDEINYDFTVLKRNKNTGKMFVLIAAAKKDMIENKISICRSIGYSPTFIDVCPLAVANYFEFAKNIKEGVYAVVNLGAAVSSVDIIEEGLLALSRDIFIGGDDFTKRISGILNKNLKEAEEIKIKSLDDNLIQSLEPIFSNLARELRASFDFYETQENRLIDKIFITGGTAKLKGLIEFLKHSLGHDIELIAFDTDKFKLKPTLDSELFRNNFNFFTIALGMAIRDL